MVEKGRHCIVCVVNGVLQIHITGDDVNMYMYLYIQKGPSALLGGGCWLGCGYGSRVWIVKPALTWR